VERPLVPFEADSDLWPYPRAAAADLEQSDGEEIIELDFEDTSALSDMDTFSRVLQNGKKHPKAGGGSVLVNGTNANGSVGERGRGRKKGKKEREAEQIRIREEIENSWDVPGPSMRVQQLHEDVGVLSRPASPSPCPSPIPVHTPPSSGDVSPVANTATANYVNGVTPKRGEEVINKGMRIDHNAAKESTIVAFAAQVPTPTSVERNAFVRELLTLIHVRDLSFPS
jgi:hypothetical protein